MDSFNKIFISILFLLLIAEGVVCGTENQDASLGSKASAAGTVSVYMAQEEVTVGEIGLDYVEIRISLSKTSNTTTDIQLNMDTVDGGSRYVYLDADSLSIYQGSTNTSARLQFQSWDDDFYVEDSIYTITISSCSPSCEMVEPRSTIVRVVSERNVSISFNYASSVYENQCQDPRSCDYGYIYMSLSRYISGDLLIPLKIGENSTATYLSDFFFDMDPPAANLSRYSNDLLIYVPDDSFVEGTEYVHLSFDEDNLPSGVVVGETGSLVVDIYDNDYARIVIGGIDTSYSEDIGTVNIVVETNFFPDSDLAISVESYSYDGATIGEDYEPFAGTYYIYAGTNITSIPVTIIDDDLAENQESISINIQASYDGTGDDFYEYGTIYIDDDETRDTPLIFSFDQTSVVADESGGRLEFVITANIKTDAFVALDFFPAEENGLMEYRDYTSYFNSTIRRNVFRFQKNTEKLITVDIIDDCEVEVDELLILNISLTSIGSADGNLTITVRDNDEEGNLMCAVCTCGNSGGNDGAPTTVGPPTDGPEEPEPLTFNFEIDEFDIYEGGCSFYDVYVTASKPTSATVFIGVQPYELDYGTDFTISAKKLVFDNSDRQNFSFRALQDVEDEAVESTLLTISYSSMGSVGAGNAILVHVWDGNATVNGMTESRFARSADEQVPMAESQGNDFGAVVTGLVAGLVSSLVVVVMTTMLLGAVFVVKSRMRSQ